MILSGHQCDITVLKVHAPREDKIDDVKEMFYEEPEYVFSKFLKYHMKILLGDFNAKVGSKDISNQQLGMIVYIKLVMILVESMMFPHHNIHIFT
jgi:hypothetical protein